MNRKLWHGQACSLLHKTSGSCEAVAIEQFGEHYRSLYLLLDGVIRDKYDWKFSLSTILDQQPANSTTEKKSFYSGNEEPLYFKFSGKKQVRKLTPVCFMPFDNACSLWVSYFYLQWWFLILVLDFVFVFQVQSPQERCFIKEWNTIK